MDTISNVATAATKAVWGKGDANAEPVSGAQGDVTKGEPYDAGNLEPDEQKKVETKLSDDKIKEKASTGPPAAGDTTSGQNDKRDPDDPSAQAVDVEGPGPRPLAEVAREHGGDAGREKEEPALAVEGMSSDDPEGSEEKGTGQEHVKTTGFASEGGDFDATKPGAGMEADHASNGDKSSSSKHSKGKPSLSQRIKAKLHRH
ncbi:hypothetical protein ACO1O0_008060 [Amphichorda felina]